MRFVADLHIHSRYSIATSKQGNPENYFRWACLKGVTVVGTGDFTHPGWFGELQEKLEPAEEGLFQLKPSYRKTMEPEVPPSCRRDVRFLLSVEISCIYKKNGRTRKIHNLVMMPDFEAAERFSQRLDRIGNIRSDGRPILGLDSRTLLEIALEAHPEVLFVPAHIWTPHFSLFGSNSGFDTVEECFEDLTPHLFAVETGLSSDPPMNWRLSALDHYALVSHSDAHSPNKLAREANLFDTELSFPAIRSALKDRDPARFLGTLEFFPEEGKYHYDGHRACGVCWRPDQTREAKGICPLCGRPVTMGVLHRVEALADRPRDTHPDAARHYENLIPLPEIIASILDVKSPTSKKVQAFCHDLLERIGPELTILRELPIASLAQLTDPRIAEGIRRVRNREVQLSPGYDGEFGRVRIFPEGERHS
ncbi:MAG: endonuclease Q family protein [Candidatus Latescibacterota bacterium]